MGIKLVNQMKEYKKALKLYKTRDSKGKRMMTKAELMRIYANELKLKYG